MLRCSAMEQMCFGMEQICFDKCISLFGVKRTYFNLLFKVLNSGNKQQEFTAYKQASDKAVHPSLGLHLLGPKAPKMGFFLLY